MKYGTKIRLKQMLKFYGMSILFISFNGIILWEALDIIYSVDQLQQPMKTGIWLLTCSPFAIIYYLYIGNRFIKPKGGFYGK